MVRKRREYDPFDLFGEIGDFNRQIRKMMEMLEDSDFEEIEKDLAQQLRKARARPGNPVVYGFSFSMGPDGKPHFEEFGNVQNGKLKGTREPAVDVINGKEEVTVVAELPGVDKEHLKLNVKQGSLHIAVTDPERRFEKELKLPEEIDEKSVKANLKNGVLEIILKKARKEAGINVRVG